MRTFLESCDFSGKTIVPFCTSNSSGIGSSDTNLHEFFSCANWLDGQRFAADTSPTTVKDWIDGLELPSAVESASAPSGTQNVLVTYFSGTGTTRGVAQNLAAALGSDGLRSMKSLPSSLIHLPTWIIPIPVAV